MKLLSRCLMVVCVVMVFGVPALAQNTGGLPGTEHVLAGVAFKHAERVVLHGNVVHYWFDVAVGPGEFEKIRIHRVVEETSPGRPVRKMEGVLLLPGQPQLFEQIFLPQASPDVPAEEGSVALFLASNGVDVWGMDYAWSFIPYGTTDFAFLEGWGVAKDTEHVRTALSIARWIRATSGQGVDPIHVLGLSYGGFLTYAVASEDTLRPGNLKNVKGIIPIDAGAFKNNSATGRATSCTSASNYAAILASGVFATDSSAVMLNGRAALDHPDALSPFGLPALPPYFAAVSPNTFTKYEWLVASYVRSLFFGGTYVPDPPFVSTIFTDGARIVRLLANTPPYTPTQVNYDTSASRCESDNRPVAFDDHLGEVAVPILAISRRQSPTADATTRTASGDITSVVMNPGMIPTLYGHADFLLANDAANVVWRPILDWILAHR